MRFRNICILFLALCLLTCRSDRHQVDGNFQIHPEFEIELVASEPLVMDPVDMEFDEYGRAFVLEMPGYPMSEEQSRIVLLEDQDDDGLYDRRTLFAGNLTVATSLMPYQGGFLVAAPPDLLFIRDTDGDNRADQRQVIMSGFAIGNTQHNFSGLTYGLDNWIYGANGGNSGSVYWPGREGDSISLMYHNFRLKIEDQAFELTGLTSGGFELAMDDWGHMFGTHNMVHISHLVFHRGYIRDIPWMQSQLLENISDHEEAGTSRIYPVGEQVTRVNHPEQSGYFSGACGIKFYGGNSFPPEFNNNIFVADVVLNLIHRDVVSRKGASYSASRGREGVEFLASKDRAFRPVNITTGPDGAMYVVDMHRPVIEHPEWIPDQIEDTLDLYEGQDKGRIYRIIPRGGLKRVRPDLDRENLTVVLSVLGHHNQWWRITAQRLLVEWNALRTVPDLVDLVHHSENPFARLHALWTLEGLNSLTDDIRIAALTDSNPGIREQAVIVSERSLGGKKELINTIASLAADPDPRVRMQVALTLGTLGTDQKATGQVMQAVSRIAEGLSDPWIRTAVVSGSQHFPLEMIQALIQNDQKNDPQGYRELLKELATLIGRNHQFPEILSLLEVLSVFKDEAVTYSILTGLADGCERSDDVSAPREKRGVLMRAIENVETEGDPSIMIGTWRLRDIFELPAMKNQAEVIERAKTTLLDSEADLDERLEYLRLISATQFEGKENILIDLILPKQPKVIQLEAVDQLEDMSQPGNVSRLLELWPTFGPEIRASVSDILIWPENHLLLLSALESGQIGLGEMKFDLERRRMLLNSRDPSIRKRAEALFSDVGVQTQEEAMEKMRPALRIAGDPEAGKTFFQILCASCHRFKDLGTPVGPDLLGISRKSDEQILFDILDPNAAVETRYLNYTIETDGKKISGIVGYESDSEIMLRGMNGVEHLVLRKDIENIYSSGVSFMPEGLEAGLEPKDMADLLAYLLE